MPGIGDHITVINRTSHDLEVQRNGQTRLFHSGENPNTPWEWLYYCKNQHPVMGTEDPGTVGVGEYLLVMKGGRDDASPIDESVEAQVERIDRSLLPTADMEPVKRKPGRPRKEAPPVMVGARA